MSLKEHQIARVSGEIIWRLRFLERERRGDKGWERRDSWAGGFFVGVCGAVELKEGEVFLDVFGGEPDLGGEEVAEGGGVAGEADAEFAVPCGDEGAVAIGGEGPAGLGGGSRLGWVWGGWGFCSGALAGAGFVLFEVLRGDDAFVDEFDEEAVESCAEGFLEIADEAFVVVSGGVEEAEVGIDAAGAEEEIEPGEEEAAAGVVERVPEVAFLAGSAKGAVEFRREAEGIDDWVEDGGGAAFHAAEGLHGGGGVEALQAAVQGFRGGGAGGICFDAPGQAAQPCEVVGEFGFDDEACLGEQASGSEGRMAGGLPGGQFPLGPAVGHERLDMPAAGGG